MIDEAPSEQSKDVSAEFRLWIALAKLVFIPALGLAVICALSCVAIAVLGEFKCGARAMNSTPDTRDFLLLPVFSALGVAMVRAMCNPSGEMLRRMKNVIEIYSVQLFEVFSIRVTFSMAVYVATLAGMLVMLCAPISIAFSELKPLWIACAKTIDT